MTGSAFWDGVAGSIFGVLLLGVVGWYIRQAAQSAKESLTFIKSLHGKRPDDQFQALLAVERVRAFRDRFQMLFLLTFVPILFHFEKSIRLSLTNGASAPSGQFILFIFAAMVIFIVWLWAHRRYEDVTREIEEKFEVEDNQVDAH